MNVVIAGGGTAGHVFPAIALAERLVEEHGAAVRFIGAAGGIESQLVSAAGFEFRGVAASPMPRKVSAAALTAAVTAVKSVRACHPIVSVSDIVVGMGGYASVPAVLAARWTKRPVVLHENDAVPGLANRLLSPRARVVALGFAGAASRLPRGVRWIVTGNPVRPRILEVVARRDELAKEAREEFVLEPDLPTVVVFGGSQGALALDRTVAGAIPLMAGRSDIQFLVLTGRGHGREMSVTGQESPVVRALEFLDRMELVYAVADVAVARAGAGSIAEISVCGVPSLLVPYPQATGNHQEANARELERAGGAEVLLNADLTPEALVARLTALLADGPRRERMGDAARAWSKPEAASRLARLVVEAA